jgi:hypothetical protein
MAAPFERSLVICPWIDLVIFFHSTFEKGWHVRRKFAGLLSGLLAPAVLLFVSSAASAESMYLSATLNVYNSSGDVIATTGTITAGAAVSGAIYSITSAANALEYGSISALTTGGTSTPGAGQSFSSFGVYFDGTDYDLYFSWDPTGNDPYTGFAGNPPGQFLSYIDPPTLPYYVYSATAFLSPTLTAAGDTALLIFATNAPEPASLALMATGGLMITGFSRLRRKMGK